MNLVKQDTQGSSILNCLSPTLTLNYFSELANTVIEKLNNPDDYLQVSMGWAASPIRRSLSLCHLVIGPLAISFQNFTSLAFLHNV